MTILRRFSRRRSSKPPRTEPSPTSTVTPSLPSLSSPPVSWPANFVDPDVARTPPRSQSALPSSSSTTPPQEGPVKSFHKPFRTPEREAGGRIHAIYASQPLKAPEFRATKGADAHPKRRVIRKPRATTPTFNIMVRATLMLYIRQRREADK
jgi:hypothetical protein